MKFNNPIPVKQLAEWTNSEIIGDINNTATGLNEIHNVQAGDITFVDHEKYYAFTLNSAATIIFINKREEAPAGKTLLLVKDPFTAYNDIAMRFQPSLKSTAVVSGGATIGEGTFIYPNAFVGDKVTIGKNCIIYPNVTIYPYTQIGDNVIIHANTTIGADAFYFKGRGTHFEKMHTAGNVVIENNVEIGANCTIDAGVSSSTIIGEGTKIDSHVHIGHDVKVGKHCIFAAQVGIGGNTKIGNFVTLYGKVGVNKNIEIGDKALVQPNSGVWKSLDGGKTYFGSPAEEMRAAARHVALIKRLPEIWDKVKGM